MKASRLVKVVCTAGLASACAFGLVACGGESNGLTGGTAATVNGTEIAEDTVTTYVQNFRTASSLEDTDAWGKWLAENSYTPQSVREDVIDYYTSQELVKQAASENNVTVDDAKVEESVQKMKSNYDSDEAWQEALKTANTTEEAYREQVQLALTETALKEVVGQAEAPTDEELLQYAAMYDGAKRSSHILFESGDTENAQSVLDRINNGEIDFADAAKENSKDSSAANGGDVGWDKLTSFVTEYTDALNGLAKDQVSGLVESQYGIHIIKCTDEFTVPEEGLTSIDQVPSEILDAVRSSLETSKQTTAFNDWYTEYKEKAEITINDMPENVPYNVDMSKYPAPEGTEGSEDGEGTDGSTDGTDTGATDGADGAATDGSTEGTDDAASGEGTDANAGEGTDNADAPAAEGTEGEQPVEGGADTNSQQPAAA